MTRVISMREKDKPLIPEKTSLSYLGDGFDAHARFRGRVPHEEAPSGSRRKTASGGRVC